MVVLDEVVQPQGEGDRVALVAHVERVALVAHVHGEGRELAAPEQGPLGAAVRQAHGGVHARHVRREGAGRRLAKSRDGRVVVHQPQSDHGVHHPVVLDAQLVR